MSRARLVITAITKQGLTQAQAARTYGLSEATVSRLMARYRTEGDAAFEPRSRAPKTSPGATPPETVDLVLRLRKQLLESGHTGIACGSDIMALGAVRAAHVAGLRVPDDVSVVGFDDSPMMAFTDPPLTTMRQPIGAMSQAVVHTLLAELSGESVNRTEMLFQSDLVVRRSTGRAR